MHRACNLPVQTTERLKNGAIDYGTPRQTADNSIESLQPNEAASLLPPDSNPAAFLLLGSLAYYVGCTRTTMLYLLLFISLLATFPAPGRAAEKDLEWKTGKLLDVQTRGRGRHASTYYAIDGGDLIYLAQRTVTRRDKPLNVTIHGNVRFAVKGSDLYLVDDDGKQHRLTLEKKTAKAGP